MATEPTIGVILLNLGGPERLEDVEPFLANLFSDRRIIRLSPFPFLQKPIARRIARKRAPQSRAAYQQIGGGSPLAFITGEQSRALEGALATEGRFRVVTAMRYWPPFADQAVADLERLGISRIVALPLYPHYSIATSGSSLEALRRVVAGRPGLQLAEIASWPEQPDYVASLAEFIRNGLAAFPAEPLQVVYSAHSLPVRFIQRGDPYVEDLQKTIRRVEDLTGVRGRLCYQSRSGPVKWLEPSTPDLLRRLAGEGCRGVLMVPISFVSDHVETLYEIDILYRRLTEELGMRFARTSSLNTHPRFITALQKLVLTACRERQWLA